MVCLVPESEIEYVDPVPSNPPANPEYVELTCRDLDVKPPLNLQLKVKVK